MEEGVEEMAVYSYIQHRNKNAIEMKSSSIEEQEQLHQNLSNNVSFSVRITTIDWGNDNH